MDLTNNWPQKLTGLHYNKYKWLLKKKKRTQVAYKPTTYTYDHLTIYLPNLPNQKDLYK